LKSLQFIFFEGSEHILTGQDEMEKFSNNELNQTSLKAICSELKSLVHLNMNDLRLDRGEPGNFQLSNFRNLKILRIHKITGTETETNNFLSSLQSNSVEKFEISDDKIILNEFKIKQLAVNLPNLRYLDIISSLSSINIINAIIQNFHNLEVLEFEKGNADAFIFQNGLKHNKLKSLRIKTSKPVNIELFKLINCCPKLEQFKILTQIYRF
jgi:hypothetical protein